MNRRRFLTLTGLSVGTAIAAEGATRGTLTSKRDAQETLADALRHAAAVGKPLILIPGPKGGAGPSDEVVAHEVAAWAHLFSSPNDELLGFLALFEFVFAEVPEGAAFDDTKHCAVYRTSQDKDWQPIPFADGDRADPATLFASLRSALANDADQITALVRAGSLSHSGQEAAHRLMWASPQSTPRLKISEADAGAAALYQVIERSDSEAYRSWGRGLLAAAASLRLYERDPLGARWESKYPDVDPCPPCGMAIVQKESKLFLDAYTKENR